MTSDVRVAAEQDTCDGRAASPSALAEGKVIPLPTVTLRGVRGLIRLLAVELPAERTQAKLQVYDALGTFAVRKGLIPPDREPELLEMLIAGASFAAAIEEARAGVTRGGRGPTS